MMPSRGSNFRSCVLNFSSPKPQLIHRAPHHASNATLPSTRSLHHFTANRTRQRPASIAMRTIISSQPSRLASTVPVALPTTSDAPSSFDASTTSTPTDPVTLPTDDFSTASLDSVISDLPLVPEKIGYLKELGLDYGWGSTAFLEYLLEHVHVYTATPWWASILLTALLVRLSLLKAYVGASDTAARMAAITVIAKPIQARMNEAKLRKDSTTYMQGVAELKDLYQKAGIKWGKLFVPFIQLPIGFGTFRLLRGMAELPVPGLEDGGLLWIKDLTIADPFFILPIATGLGIHYTVKLGGELATSMPNPMFYKASLYAMPVLAGGFMLLYPAAMQLTFGFTAALSFFQAYVLRQPWVRAFLGIHPLPNKQPDLSKSEAVSGRLNMYQAPTEALPEPAVKSGMAIKAKEKVLEVKGVASKLGKSVTGIIRPQTKHAVKSAPAIFELTKAQQLQEKRLRELARFTPKAGQPKRNPTRESPKDKKAHH